jgi:CARDB/Right handed beta helix region/Bacterial Ig-like domain
VAQGTAAAPILFTSSQSSPAPGDWSSIEFLDTSHDGSTILDHCIVEYGGSSYGALYLYNASPSIQYSTIRYSKYDGIYSSGTGCQSTQLACNTFSNNNRGIFWSVEPPPEMHDNNFTGNTSYGLYYTRSTTLNAENNWWADAQGPGTGGDALYGNVDADPWSVQLNDCIGPVENQPPNTPLSPTPADASVRVAVDSGASLSWIGGDPNPLDVVTYDLYWGTTPESLQLAVAAMDQPAYTQSPVNPGLTYYWQVIAKDDKGAETPGAVWHFTADGDPPDLIISQVDIDPPGHLQAGQSVTLTAHIQNNGTGPVVDPFAMDFKAGGVSFGTFAVDQILLAGQGRTVSQTWTYAGGDPSLDITADSQAQVSETNEDNNHFIALLSEVADNTAPVLMGTSPTDGDYLQQIEHITATLLDSQGTVDDAAVIAGFSVVDGSQQSVAGTVAESNDTFTFIPAGLPLPDSTYRVSLTAADTYGNTRNCSFAFTIDTQAPAKPIITGASVASGTIQVRPAQNIADQFMAELTGTREAGTSVWVNGVQQVGVGDDAWSVNLLLQPDDNAFEIWLKDRAGNQGASEWVDIRAQFGNAVTYDYNAAGRVRRISGQN